MSGGSPEGMTNPEAALAHYQAQAGMAQLLREKDLEIKRWRNLAERLQAQADELRSSRPAQTEQQPANFRKARCISMRPGMGEVTFYVEGGVPSFMDPGCTIYVSGAAPIAQAPADGLMDDTQRLDFMCTDYCAMDILQTGVGERFRLVWPWRYERQSEVYPSAWDAVDAALAAHRAELAQTQPTDAANRAQERKE